MYTLLSQAPPHIDLLDLEEDTMSMESLRTLLIERKEETMQVLGKIRIDDHHHIVHNEIQFAYTPIKKTPYRYVFLVREREREL